MNIIDGFDVWFNNTIIYNVISQKSLMIAMSDTVVKSISNFTIADTNMTAVSIHQSTISSISELMVNNVSLALQMSNSHVKSISQSNFVECGKDTNIYGGAIKSFNSNFTISNSSFFKNTARNGGAIAVLCDEYDEWA